MSKLKATLAEIIARKKQGEIDKLQVKHYDSETLGMQIEIRKIPLAKYMNIVEGLEDENLGGMNTLIYECCPMFRENTKEAMEVYGVAESTDLPAAILEEQLNEMKDIVEIINSFYGLDKIGDEIKNL
ncbi:hypothetical protein [Clostridium formicaceticum]|uniref:Uncharacterized protein n=1 Tax=Clostridium formicaceticum TaxID=1497 RepID=A0AAC9RJB2_9CLOT|nr:hypothetical protein [Clostridium formicaceticum]AOY76685.1 hypothetical protein BJL90_12900 [Clostridium formicaceticum]ARE87116.1 hypothetical protein CLFO_15020 [Clostridium formicaceticum]